MTRIENDTCEWGESISQFIAILLALPREEPLTSFASSNPPTRQLNHSGRPLPLRSWNAHSKRTYGSLCKERGSRSSICDRHTQPCLSVTNGTPRPSLFAQATVSSFRVCVPTSQREMTTGVIELPAGRIGSGKRSKGLFWRKRMEACNKLVS